MEIQQIKQSLNLTTVLTHYGLKPRNKMLKCPFHEDEKASLQVHLEKNFYKCHACGKMGDVIQWIQDYEKLSKHEALMKCVELINVPIGQSEHTPVIKTENKTENYQEIYGYLQPKLVQSSKAKNYLQSRNLDYKNLEAGYNTGKEFDKLKYCVVFPLRNKQNQIVSLYGRSTVETSEAKHFYTANRSGLYPNYPPESTRKLILTESIIDCASLTQALSLEPTDYSILACYGTNGLTEEHLKAIQELPHLEEIIFFFDGDLAGREAVKKHAKQLAIINCGLSITTVETPEEEDINSLSQGHEPELFTELLNNRLVLNHFEEKTLFVSTEHKPETPAKPTVKEDSELTIGNNYSKYEDDTLKIEVLGNIDRKDLGQLRVTLAVYNTTEEHFPARHNLNLYNDDQVEKTVRKIAEKIGIGTIVIRKAISQLTQALEKYRMEHQDQSKSTTKNRHPLRVVTLREQEIAKETLKRNNLRQIISQKLLEVGVIGEEKNALFLFVILLSHKMKRTLHAVVQGTSGSGKSHIIKKIADTMFDQNKIKRYTRVTDKSFYNYGEFDIVNCGIILEDYDGLTEEAELAWRELQSSGKLSSSVSQKNEITGEILTGEKYVYGPIASLVATTKFRIYDDNESRVFVISIDESEEQTEKVLDYMAKKSAKTITEAQENKTLEELQNMVYCLERYEVQNPYRLELPKTTKQRRRLTQMLHDFIEQITILNQYQRQKVDETTLKTELQDLEIAVDLMFNSIVLKTDELDGILRQFYEDLKKYIESKSANYEFTQREIRQLFRISKTQTQRYFNELEELEYINRSAVGKRNSYNYQISYWDNIEKLRQEIRQYLQDQIDQYRSKANQ